MGQKSGPVKEPAEQVVKEIRRATRRQFSAEEKIRIVLSGLRGEDSIAELCRREGIVQNLYYRWSKEFLEAGKKRLAGDTARAATSDEVKDPRREAGALKEVVAELMLENRLLKKSMIGAGEDGACWRSFGWSSTRRCRCAIPWRNSAFRGRPFTAGTIDTAMADGRP
jgi:transposase